jgi:molybdate transport system regulatory protein
MATQKTTTPKARADSPNAPVLKLRMRISTGDQIAVGPGKIALLEALAEQGSITAAAKSLDMSYRRAWLLIDELNRSLSEPAVASATGGQRGGGSELTPAGKRLIELYRIVEAQALKACAPDIRKLMKMLAKA